MDDKFRDEEIDGLAGSKVTIPREKYSFIPSKTILWILSIIGILVFIYFYQDMRSKYYSSYEGINKLLGDVNKNISTVDGKLVYFKTNIDEMSELLQDSLIRKDSSGLDSINLILVKEQIIRKLDSMRDNSENVNEDIIKLREKLLEYSKTVE